ncbi:MAG: hypothetical protein HXO22_00595 [Prevotella sp.]|nr:hypothetical protein [Prevotella sp.]MBF1584256.1 hypothetical protein [Prevotella sp.]
MFSSIATKIALFFGVSSVFPSTFLLAYSSPGPSPFYPYLLIFRTRVPPPAAHFSRVWRIMAVLHAFVLGRGAIIKGGRWALLWGKVVG